MFSGHASPHEHMQAVENLRIITGMAISPEHHVNYTAHVQGIKMIVCFPMESPLIRQLSREQIDIEEFQWYINEFQREYDELDTTIYHTSPAGERLSLQVSYMTSGREKKLKFTAVKPEDMAEFLDIVFGTNIKPSVMEIIRINEVTAALDVHVQNSGREKN
jgi:hypothetical protein